MNLRIFIQQEIKDTDGALLDEAPFAMEANVADEVLEVLGNGNAEVSMGLSKKMGGPGYSSVSLYVSVKLRCGQDTETLRAAQEVAMDEAITAMDAHFDNAVELLKQSLRTHKNFA